jgi:DNA-directed RNA polymerase specialized sigma24 family protein
VLEDRGPSRPLDPLLVPFVAAPTEDAARPLLAAVVAHAATPVVRDVVRRHVTSRDADGASDGEDVEHTVLARLTQQLWRQRAGADDPIGNLAAYAARAATNACHERLRARRPQRARLQAQLRYVFRHHAALALWERRDGSWVCGEAVWRERDAEQVLGWPAVAEWRGRIAVPAVVGPEAVRIVRLAETIVGTLGAAARLEDVVMLAADALGIVDAPVEPTVTASGEFVSPLSRSGVASGTPPADEQLDQQRFLERVWAEIRDLPVRQRTALLLNLTGPSSQDMLSLMPATGVATWAEIAATLDIDADRLRALVPGLPHDDHTIAGLLQVTRRQVINLRKCARERLARRLGFARGGREGGRR